MFLCKCPKRWMIIRLKDGNGDYWLIILIILFQIFQTKSNSFSNNQYSFLKHQQKKGEEEVQFFHDYDVTFLTIYHFHSFKSTDNFETELGSWRYLWRKHRQPDSLTPKNEYPSSLGIHPHYPKSQLSYHRMRIISDKDPLNAYNV